MSKLDIRFLNRLSQGSFLPILLQLNTVTLRVCWGEAISLMSAQVQVSSQERLKTVCLEKKNDFRFLVFCLK